MLEVASGSRSISRQKMFQFPGRASLRRISKRSMIGLKEFGSAAVTRMML